MWNFPVEKVEYSTHIYIWYVYILKVHIYSVGIGLTIYVVYILHKKYTVNTKYTVSQLPQSPQFLHLIRIRHDYFSGLLSFFTFHLSPVINLFQPVFHNLSLLQSIFVATYLTIPFLNQSSLVLCVFSTNIVYIYLHICTIRKISSTILENRF